MKELLLEILGWLGYLERPSVLLQLLISLAALTLCRLARQRRWQKRWQKNRRRNIFKPACARWCRGVKTPELWPVWSSWLMPAVFRKPAALAWNCAE